MGNYVGIAIGVYLACVFTAKAYRREHIPPEVVWASFAVLAAYGVIMHVRDLIGGR